MFRVLFVAIVLSCSVTTLWAQTAPILAGTFSRMTQDPLIKLENEDFPTPAAEAVNSATLRDHARALLTARLDKTLPAHLKEE